MVSAEVNISYSSIARLLVFFLIAQLYLLSSPIHAQERVGLFWNYTVDDGLPSNEVYHIHEDSKGYIWFATANGISRFDGYEFHNYSVEEGIPESDIFQIVEDSSGKLYLYSILGRVYEGNENGFNLFSAQSLIDSLVRKYKLYGYAYKGHLRIGNRGHLHYIRPGLHLEFKHHVLIDKNIHTHSNIILHDKSNVFFRNSFAVTIHSEDALYNDSLLYKENKLTVYILQDTIYKNIIQTAHLSYLLTTGGIKWSTIKDEDRYLFSHYSQIFCITKDELLWTSPIIPGIEIIKKLEGIGIAVGQLTGEGIRIYENYNDIQKSIYKTKLKGFYISYIYEDSKGDIWISTTNQGVLKTYRSSFNKIIPTIPDSFRSIRYLSSDINSKLYLSDDKNNLLEVNLLNGKFRYLDNFNNNRIKDIQYDVDNESLWFTQYTLNNWKKEKLTTIWVKGDDRPDAIWNKYRKTKFTAGNNKVHITNKGVWVGGSQNFSLINKDNLIPEYVETKIFEGAPLRVNCIHELEEDHVLLGTQRGVFTFDLDSIVLSNDSIFSQDIPVYHIQNSPIGLFFGTKGRGVYHNVNDQTTIIGKAEGLTSNFVEALLPLDTNELWVGTPEGLDRIIFDSTGGYEFKYYSVATGLPSNTINDLEYCNGKVYVATPEGLGIIDPDEKIETHPIQPLISEVLVNNHPYTIEDLKELGSTERNLIIKYDCLDYKQMGNILYRYRLKERDIWNETKERTVNLLRLPPGNYRFEVQAMGADRSWSDSKTLRFSIAPPLWQRYWFWGAISISVFGLVFTYTRSRFREVKRQASLQQKVAHLERKALRAQMNPHFIFNVMHSIQGYISEGDTQNATRYVSKFARLIRATLNHSRMTKIPLEEEIQNLKEYLDLENMRMDGQLTYQFHIPEELDSFDYDIPPMLIQPFLENSIKHGISPNGKGHIDVKIRKINQHLEVEITDNGIGIKQSMKQNKDKKDQPSLGMNIARERLSVLEGKEMEEHIHIEELKDGEGEAIGTQVVLLIKINDEY